MSPLPNIAVHHDTPPPRLSLVGVTKTRAASARRERAQVPCPNIAPPIFYDVEACPTRTVLPAILGKWSVLILTHLSFGQHRYSELRGALPDISERMLSKTLKSLTEEGLIHREATRSMPPRVDYRLTPTGESLLPALEQLLHWGLRRLRADREETAK